MRNQIEGEERISPREQTPPAQSPKPPRNKGSNGKAVGFIIRQVFFLSLSLYIGGIVGQFVGNSGKLDNIVPLSFDFMTVLTRAVSTPTGWIGIIISVIGLNGLYAYLTGGDNGHGEKDKDRNFSKSGKDTYGTSGWMTRQEFNTILHESDPRDTDEIILGELDGKVVTLPNQGRMNRHIAVYGASGTGKSRAFARTYILQCCKREESMVLTDPKGELYQSMAPYLRKQGYDVKVLNIKDSDGMQHSDSWNCLAEIEGDELNAQIFSDVIIQNTSQGAEKSDFWSKCEMNLLKALCLYAEMDPDHATPAGRKPSMSSVYDLISTKSPSQLEAMFDSLPQNDRTYAARSAFNIYRQAPDNTKGSVVIGLGSRLQVFQGNMVRQVTNYNEIDLKKPGKEKCAYFCITSDQQSAFDFLAVLFYAMMFIKLVNLADTEGIDGRCPVPVNFILDEFPNIGAIPDFTKKISTVRSRGLNIAVIFQNIAQLQNRYPFGQWEEILGNCDTHLFLGCTDATTADFISDRTGVMTVEVSSQSRQRSTWQVTNSSQYSQSESIGKRALLTKDEVLRLDPEAALVILRGQKPLKIKKFDYSHHPEAGKLSDENVSTHTPTWWTLYQSEQAGNTHKQPSPKTRQSSAPVSGKPPGF